MCETCNCFANTLNARAISALICKPEEGWYSRNTVMNKQYRFFLKYKLCSSLWMSRFLFLIFYLIRSLFLRSNVDNWQDLSSTVFVVNILIVEENSR